MEWGDFYQDKISLMGSLSLLEKMGAEASEGKQSPWFGSAPGRSSDLAAVLGYCGA